MPRRPFRWTVRGLMIALAAGTVFEVAAFRLAASILRRGQWEYDPKLATSSWLMLNAAAAMVALLLWNAHRPEAGRDPHEPGQDER